jgi:hypothetical protein
MRGACRWKQLCPGGTDEAQYVDSVRTVVRKNNHAFVADELHPIEIDKGEMMEELEAE